MKNGEQLLKELVTVNGERVIRGLKETLMNPKVRFLVLRLNSLANKFKLGTWNKSDEELYNKSKNWLAEIINSSLAYSA